MIKYNFTVPDGSDWFLTLHLEPKQDSKSISCNINPTDEVEIQILEENEDWANLMVLLPLKKKNSVFAGWLNTKQMYLTAEEVVKLIAGTGKLVGIQTEI
jgi:hypothetical protein